MSQQGMATKAVRACTEFRTIRSHNAAGAVLRKSNIKKILPLSHYTSIADDQFSVFDALQALLYPMPEMLYRIYFTYTPALDWLNNPINHQVISRSQSHKPQARFIRFASANNSARKSGCAIAIISCTRCLADLPRNCATPNSVTT